MNKPTPHRLLHDALEPEVYAKVMRNFDANKSKTMMDGFLHSPSVLSALSYSFNWSDSKEGRKYWESIYDKLLKQEQLDNE